MTGFDLAGWLAGPYVFFFFDDAGLLSYALYFSNAMLYFTILYSCRFYSFFRSVSVPRISRVVALFYAIFPLIVRCVLPALLRFALGPKASTSGFRCGPPTNTVVVCTLYLSPIVYYKPHHTYNLVHPICYEQQLVKY